MNELLKRTVSIFTTLSLLSLGTLLRLGVGLGLAELDAPFEAVGERPFATATGVDLGFDHGGALRQQGEGGVELGGRLGGGTLGDGHAEFLEERFGLILVNVHGVRSFVRNAGGKTRQNELSLFSHARLPTSRRVT